MKNMIYFCRVICELPCAKILRYFSNLLSKRFFGGLTLLALVVSLLVPLASFGMSNTKQISIPINLITYFAETGNARLLAYLIHLKHKFRNSRIYPGTIRELARKFDCSTNTINHYLKECISIGFAVRHHNGTIEFIKKSAMCKLLGFKSTGRCITYCYDKTKPAKKAVYELEALLIKLNINQQQYVIDKKTEVANILIQRNTYDKKSYRTFKKFVKNCREKNIDLKTATPDSVYSILDINKKTMLSNETIGKLISRSKSTGKRRQKRWNADGIIKSTMNFVKLQRMTLDTFLLKKKFDFCISGSFYKDGWECRRTANEIVFINC